MLTSNLAFQEGRHLQLPQPPAARPLQRLWPRSVPVTGRTVKLQAPDLESRVDFRSQVAV